MRERVINVLQDCINQLVDFIYSVAEKNNNGNPISFYTRRELNEILESFYHTTSLNVLKPQEAAILKRIFKVGEHIIFEKLLHLEATIIRNRN